MCREEHMRQGYTHISRDMCLLGEYTREQVVVEVCMRLSNVASLYMYTGSSVNIQLLLSLFLPFLASREHTSQANWTSKQVSEYIGGMRESGSE